jgi:hypothetical protein
MILAIDPATEAQGSSRWLLGISVMLFSLVVLAENAARIDISPAYDDERLQDGVYSNASGWRKPPAYENEWRPEQQEQQGRIQFGYDAVYEEMRAKDSNVFSPTTGSGLTDQPQNTQFKIGF